MATAATTAADVGVSVDEAADADEIGEVAVVVGVVAKASRRHQLVVGQPPRPLGRDGLGLSSVFLE